MSRSDVTPFVLPNGLSYWKTIAPCELIVIGSCVTAAPWPGLKFMNRPVIPPTVACVPRQADS